MLLGKVSDVMIVPFVKARKGVGVGSAGHGIAVFCPQPLQATFVPIFKAMIPLGTVASAQQDGHVGVRLIHGF
jgi:hypothetical protein